MRPAPWLSDEGAFTAAGGPAAGATSTDIGVSQSGSEPAGLPDDDPATSEGIFVFDAGGPALALGDRVRITATAVEFGGLTEITTVTATKDGELLELFGRAATNLRHTGGALVDDRSLTRAGPPTRRARVPMRRSRLASP